MRLVTYQEHPLGRWVGQVIYDDPEYGMEHINFEIKGESQQGVEQACLGWWEEKMASASARAKIARHQKSTRTERHLPYS